jgi:uncharacterized protein GlcG (DUF336 family)
MGGRASIGTSAAGSGRSAACAALLCLLLTLALLLAPAARAAQPKNKLPRQVFLTQADVTRILQQGVLAAQQRKAPAVLAVVDRVGNVLAVYAMPGAPTLLTVDPGRNVIGTRGRRAIDGGSGLAGVNIIPAAAAAIAKAITGAYLSSGGNAFSTRTASQIVQENFVPGSKRLEGGPLFGVQFSSLPCSDLMVRFETDSDPTGVVSPIIGPKRSPLGLSADPGGLPLYKGGTLVGGVAAVADSRYTLDRNIRDSDNSKEEQIAFLAGAGFTAPTDLRADRVTVDGRSLRFSDARPKASSSFKSKARAIDLNATGALVAVTGYHDGLAIRAGQAFGFPGSGIEPDPDGLYGTSRAYVLTTADGANRFPPRDATTGPGGITAEEVRGLLTQALRVALQARGQIRRPLNSHAEVTISVVDSNGAILGIVRTPDAPVFGTDVSLQKARTAMFFSSGAAPADLTSVGLGGYYDDLQVFLGPAFVPGKAAFGNRSIGNLSRPFYPDGQNGRSNGPLSVAFRSWSPFNTGLQLDLVLDDIVAHVLFVLGLGSDAVPICAGTPTNGLARLANGEQIFSGGVPIYRSGSGQLVGGIGVSGDGIDQDDMVGFLGLSRFTSGGGKLRNAIRGTRADRFKPVGANLRYVQCPYKPFLSSNAQSVCQGR